MSRKSIYQAGRKGHKFLFFSFFNFYVSFINHIKTILLLIIGDDGMLSIVIHKEETLSINQKLSSLPKQKNLDTVLAQGGLVFVIMPDGYPSRVDFPHNTPKR